MNPASPRLFAYHPQRADPVCLEQTLVQREALLADLLERVGESATSGHRHHLLFTGPPGIGKTHLLAMLMARLERTSFAGRLRTVWLDSTWPHQFHEWLSELHAALVTRFPEDFDHAAATDWQALPPETQEQHIRDSLLEGLHGRTLLVLQENLDLLFARFGEHGQQRLRALLQEYPLFVLVTTATRLTSDLSDRRRPFFGFFQIEPLRPLGAGQARELLEKLARQRGDDTLTEALHGAHGRACVRALQTLTAGVPRTCLQLSTLLESAGLEHLPTVMEALVDLRTPNILQPVRCLAPLQQRIVAALCEDTRPQPVKTLAQRLTSTQQSISGQLRELRGKELVRAHAHGRESFYEVADPWLRWHHALSSEACHAQLSGLFALLSVWYELDEHAGQFAALLPAQSFTMLRLPADPEGFPDAPAEPQDANGDLLIRAFVHWRSQALADCREDLQTLLARPDSTPRIRLDALWLHTALLLEEGHAQDGLQTCAAVLELGNREGLPASCLVDETMASLFDNPPSPARRRAHLQQWLEQFACQEALPLLGAALVRHLHLLQRRARENPGASAALFMQWLNDWQTIGRDLPALAAPLRMLETGCEFLQRGQVSVLDTLHQEEAHLLRQILPPCDPAPA